MTVTRPDTRTATRAASRRRLDHLATYVAAVGLALVTWQVLAVPLDLRFYLSTPLEVWAVLVDWFSTGSIWIHIWSSLYATIVGFLLGGIAGVSVALALYRSPVAEAAVSPYFTAAFALPKAALAPMLILWFGIGAGPKIALGTIVGAFLFYHYVLEGLKDVPLDMIDAVRVMGASDSVIRNRILLPAARASLVYAAQISLPKVFTAVIVGEVIGSNRGLGQLARFYAARFQARYVFAAILIMVIVSVALYYALGRFTAPGGEKLQMTGE